MLRIVCFEIAGLKSEVGVSDAVRFWKSVVRELGHQREDLLRFVLFDSARDGAQNEFLFLARHLFAILLAHRFAETVRLGHRIPGKFLGQLHRLRKQFLLNHA